MTLVVGPKLLIRRTVEEGNMPIANVVEEVYLVLLEQQACGDRVDGSVTPALIEKATCLVEMSEEINILLRPQPIEVANFEI